MQVIRALIPADLPAIAALRGRAFRFSEWATPAELERALQHTFFEHPWKDGRIASLVYERDGRIVGFLGVIPRPFRWKGRRITVAISTLFMTDPDDRKFAGIELLARFFEGPQDLALADSANDASRLLWTRAGGAVAPGYGFGWTRALRPFEHAIGQTLGGAGLGLGRGLRPLARLLDAVVIRQGTPPYRLVPERAAGRSVGLPEFAEAAGSVLRPYPLASELDGAALEWVVDWLAGRRDLGPVRLVVVRDDRGAVRGCYAYAGQRAARSVICFCAGERDFDTVFDDLCRRAWQEGAVSLEGRAEGGQLGLFGRRRDVALHHGSHVLVHARQRELVDVFCRGDGFLSRLDGEWWMRF